MNVLKTPFNRCLTGQEIKDWIWFHMNNKTRYTKTASGMKKYFNLLDNEKYIIRTDGGEITVEVSCNN